WNRDPKHPVVSVDFWVDLYRVCGRESYCLRLGFSKECHDASQSFLARFQSILLLQKMHIRLVGFLLADSNIEDFFKVFARHVLPSELGLGDSANKYSANYTRHLRLAGSASKGIPGGLVSSKISHQENDSFAAAAGNPFLTIV